MAAINKKLVTKHLEALAAQVVDAELVDGDVVEYTRAERLAQLIWKTALGYTEELPNGAGTTVHPPATWAITHILDRLEGKVKPADAPNEDGDLIRKRIHAITNTDSLNALADAAVHADSSDSVPGHPADMDGPDNESEDSEDSGG